MPLPPLEDILRNLRTIADEVQKNPDFCLYMKQQLKECGYARFGDISNERELKESLQVMEVLAVAVNEAISQKKVDFQVDLVSPRSIDVVYRELHQLLEIDKDKSLEKYFDLKQLAESLAEARSPLNMAQYLKSNAPQWVAKNIIQYQFHMKWNTDTGEPNDYTFYQFCVEVDINKFLKYKPRQAHVKAMLYKECRRRRAELLTKKKLCPNVYIKTAQGWISWQTDKEDEFNDVNIKNDLSWIDPSILNFITENADEQKVENLQSPKVLAKPTLYWAVLNDGEFYSGGLIEEIGKTQVYVGKAINGIRGRWFEDKNNHCAMMKKCLENVCAMSTTYDPSTLKGIQLVDARLALAKVKEEKTALFVIKTFGDDIEKAEIVQQKAEVCLNEAQRCVDDEVEEERIASLQQTAQRRFPAVPTYLREALPQVTRSRLPELQREVKNRQEILEEAKDFLDVWQNSETSKVDAETELKRAEILHKMGKRIHHKNWNIIPREHYNISWKPTDMKYGMNSY